MHQCLVLIFLRMWYRLRKKWANQKNCWRLDSYRVRTNKILIKKNVPRTKSQKIRKDQTHLLNRTNRSSRNSLPTGVTHPKFRPWTIVSCPAATAMAVVHLRIGFRLIWIKIAKFKRLKNLNTQPIGVTLLKFRPQTIMSCLAATAMEVVRLQIGSKLI